MVETLTFRAYAKINLTLEVYGSRADGYHEVVTLLQNVSLADMVRIKLASGSDTRLVVRGACLPRDNRNLAWQAVEAMRRYTGFTGGVEIELEKRIPVAAGLAGGSADAAAVLQGLNVLAGLGLTGGELVGLARELGADVAFQVVGAPAVGRGRGEHLDLVPSKLSYWVVLGCPELEIRAAEAYTYWDAAPVRAAGATARARRALEQGRVAQLAASLFNALEEPVTAAYPVIGALRRSLEQLGLAAVMSGSGPCVFGITGEEQLAREAAAALQPRYSRVYVARALGSRN